MRVLALAAMLMLAGWGSAAAAHDEPAIIRLKEHCRIAASEGSVLSQAAPRLARCLDRAPPSARGKLWVEYRGWPTGHDDPQAWKITFDNHQGRHLRLWLMDESGRVQSLDYDPDNPARTWSPGNYFSLFAIRAGPAVRVIAELDGAQSHTLVRSPRVALAATFGPVERDLMALYGIAIGMLGLTILFHFSLFFAIRRRFQLIYCAHVALLLGYGLCYSGIIRIFAPALTATAVSSLLGFTMAAATATGIAFVVDFLGRASVPRWARRWSGVSVALSAIVAGLLLLSPPAWRSFVFYAANLIAVHAILLTIVILIVAFRRGAPAASILALGWLPPIVASLMYPARNFGLIPDSFLPDGIMLMASTLECLILSLPVASRIRDLRIDHERADERHAMLERQAQTDLLTGLANRRGFGDALTRAAAASATALPIAVLVIDIDHFKRVNDRHGHATGDAILRAVASHVARVAGKGAIVARMGGEEFVVALRGHDLMRAGTIAERIRKTLNLSLEAEGSLPPVTISIGVAAGQSDKMDALIEDADSALYRAKDEGRDRVMLSDGPLVYAAAA